MKHEFSLFTLIITLLLFSSCGSSKQESSHSEQTQASKEKMIPNPPPPLAPGSCKIIATVEAIDKTLKGTNEKDPCGKAPCIATIRIESILGYGSSFPKPLTVGQIMQVKFAQTLNPTKDVWPDIKPALSGLRVDDKFEALINAAEVMGSSEQSFTIHTYVRK